MALTLVPDLLAREGLRYTALDDPQAMECEGCPVRKLCYEAGPGHYEVKALRPVTHPCELHEGRMRVVEAEPAPFETTLEARKLRGTAATFTAIDCGFPECGHWHLCHPAAPAGKYTIDEVGEAVECPVHLDIRRVRLS